MFKSIKPAEQLAEEKLLSAKDSKRNVIRQSFKEESNKPVEVNSVLYHGGYESATKLDAAVRLVQTAGLDSVTFYDVENNESELAVSDALEVVTVIASKYQQDLVKKQGLMRQIQAASLEELDGINWESN